MTRTRTTRTFAQRTETFGVGGTDWAADAFRLIFNVPRAYRPLVDAWEERFPGTRRALDRLVAGGFVAHQGGLVFDTRTGRVSERAGRPVPRYVITAPGRRLLAEMDEDLRILEDRFPRLDPGNARGVARLLASFDLSGSDGRLGMSGTHARDGSGLAERTARWWVGQLERNRLIRRLPVELADVREIIPEHWRVTRQLCRQLSDVLDNIDGAPAHLSREFRLSRRRFLDDIDPARVGVAGATDFDHDVTAQQILAAMLTSDTAAAEGILAVEPRFSLPVDTGRKPWTFDRDGTGTVFYQPDAEMRERADGKVRRSILEYERYQTRRDAWSHVERFCGMLHTTSYPVEPAVLRFVVDTPGRVRHYVELIEAFCDHGVERPELMPANPVTLAVSDVRTVVEAEDALDLSVWFRIDLPPGAGGVPVLHPKDLSPYRDYFG